MARIQDIDLPYLEFAEGAAPGTPASAVSRLYVKSDGLFYSKDDAGVETLVSSSAGLSDPMTTRGDIIVRNASNVTARLGRGSASQVLTSDGTDVAWATPTGGTPAMVRLAQTILGSDTASITFASISGSYENLLIIGQARTDRANANDYVEMQFNADTGANYHYSNWDATPTNTPTTGAAALLIAPVSGNSATAGRAGGFRILIPAYARTTWHKTALGESIYAHGVVSTKNAGVWANTAAITQVLLKPNVGPNFKTGTVATLYGLT
jgi:hypothetical protein